MRRQGCRDGEDGEKDRCCFRRQLADGAMSNQPVCLQDVIACISRMRRQACPHNISLSATSEHEREKNEKRRSDSKAEKRLSSGKYS